MKIIDILNAKANGTLKDEFSFGYKGMIYTYNKKEDAIKNCNNSSIGNNYKLEECLNDEILVYKEDEKAESIEIKAIEEHKEIEELHILDEGNSNRALYKYCSKILIKQNELVRAVNKIKKESKWWNMILEETQDKKDAVIIMMIKERDQQIELLEIENANLKRLLIETVRENRHLEKMIKKLRRNLWQETS